MTDGIPEQQASSGKRAVFFVSDRTGITAEAFGHTLLTQFEGVEFETIRCPFVDSGEKATLLVRRINEIAAQGARPLVFSSLVDPALRELVAASHGVLFDLFEMFIGPLEAELGARTTQAIGRAHGMGVYSAYKTRIDAVNFALVTDDGVTTRRYAEADIILIGVSRSGKTPTCLYLALHYGIRAANYPLTEEDLRAHRLPGSLQPYRSQLFGLTIDPARLQQIRTERRPGSPYATLDVCRQEVKAAEALFQQERIAFLNTSTISIEEISTTILDKTGMVRRI
jgi:regulator of PEP synthase PpsR (kinase-PPPase family)